MAKGQDMAQIDQEQATQIANAYLKSLGDYSASGGLMLQEQFTREKPYGWIFFYNTRAYIETGNFLHALGGVAPFLVERDGGGIYSFGTSQPLDDAVAEYERTHSFPSPSGDQPAMAGAPQPFAPSQPLGAMGPYAPSPSQPFSGAMPPPDVAPGGYPSMSYPPGAYPYGAYPTGAYPPGMYAPGNYPPSGAYPPGNYPTGGYPPGAFPPGAYPTGNYPTGAYAPPMGATSPQPKSPPARWIIPVAIGAALIIILVTILVGSNLITQAQHASATATSIAQATGTAKVSATNFANEVTQLAISNNATGTAQAVVAMRPYHAAVPGPCDKGGATWELGNFAKVSCTRSEMSMASTSSQYLGIIYFRGYTNFNLPNDVKVEVTVRTPDNCGTIILREDSQGGGGYGFSICPGSGFWDLARYDSSSGNSNDLANGFVAASASYHIQAIAVGSALTYVVGGNTVAKVTNGIYTSNGSISLGEGATGVQDAAYFSNFTYTPLSNG
jgi:hypothetical protein